MGIIDWLIVAIFLGALITIGYLFSHKNKNIEDYFVAGRSMPGWIVAIAAAGTTISAGTFVGSPELGFNTNLTYVINLLGSILGGTLVAALIMPKLYNAKTITIYGFIGERFGEKAKRTNSVMFLLGQLFTSGSRLFIAAIAVSVIIFGKIEFTFIVCSIIILGIISTFYTMMGGIKGLLYIDTFQTLLMTFTGVVALVMVYCSLKGFSLADIWTQLTAGGMVKMPGADAALLADGTLQGWEPGSKVKMFDPSLDFSKPYTIIGGSRNDDFRRNLRRLTGTRIQHEPHIRNQSFRINPGRHIGRCPDYAETVQCQDHHHLRFHRRALRRKSQED